MGVEYFRLQLYFPKRIWAGGAGEVEESASDLIGCRISW